MPLAGTFDVLDFSEVMSLLSRREATGRLLVRAGSTHGTIWMAGGKATSAEVGSAVGAEARSKWRAQIDEICFEALRHPRGSFEFHPEDETLIPAGTRVDLETVVETGRHRLEMWREVESVIHSFDAVPRMADALGDQSLTLDPDSWRVLVTLDGRRSVSALAKRMDIELLEFCQLLKPLIEGGAVVIEQPEGWLKSLPKVRLELGARDGDWPGGAPPVLDTAGKDGTPLISVGSTVTDVSGSAPGRESPAQEEGERGGQVVGRDWPAVEVDDADVDDEPGGERRRLRLRSRSRRSAGAGYDH